MNPLTRTFGIRYVDDYRSGPQLRCKEFLNEQEQTDEWDDYVDFTLSDARFHVYKMNPEKCDKPNLVRSFDTLDQAQLYVKQQYKLVTGDFPFVPNGYNEAYHPTGGRPEISMDGVTADMDEDDEDSYVFIVQLSYFETFIFNPYVVW